jgi:tight adherence protein C
VLGVLTRGLRVQHPAWCAGGAAIGVVPAALAVGVNGSPAPFAVVIVVGCAASAVFARGYAVRLARRRRLARLADELPVVLEFLSLSLSAGEGILDALRRAARIGSGRLSAELAGVVASVGTGLPLTQSLVDLDSALDLPPVSRCIEQIVIALERGTPLADVLHAQAQDARDDAQRSLIEAAGRKEVAMLFPLVFAILPLTICFAIFPGIVVLQTSF